MNESDDWCCVTLVPTCAALSPGSLGASKTRVVDLDEVTPAPGRSQGGV
jgi:hypothetical protein